MDAVRIFQKASFNFTNYGVYQKICHHLAMYICYCVQENCTLSNTQQGQAVPITVSSQLKKTVASFSCLLPCPVCALTKSAKLCSSCQPTAVAALCCAVVCTPCQGTDSSPYLTQKNTTMLYNNTVMDFCFKND